MERLIEIFFDQFVKEICGEGERRIKLQAFSAGLEVIRGVRRLFLLGYFLCFACFLSAISFFGLGYLLAGQWFARALNFSDPRLIFCAAVFGGSTLLLALTVREKKWEAAFRLRERIEELERSSSSAGFSEAELARLIGKIVDEKMHERLSPETQFGDKAG
jgi:hypothetical protein